MSTSILKEELASKDDSIDDKDKEKFNCQYCNKPFSTKSNLKTHQKNTKKCLELRKEILNNNSGENIDEIKTPSASPSLKGFSKSESVDDVSQSTLSNIETEIRYLVDSNLNLLTQIVELNKQIRTVSSRLNQIDKKYQNMIPNIARLVTNSGLTENIVESDDD